MNPCNQLILLNRILNLNAPLQFERADIGRCRLPTNGHSHNLQDAQITKPPATTPKASTSRPRDINPVTTTGGPPVSCAQTPNLPQNIRSLIFGNSPKSHGKIVIDPKEVQES